MDARGRHARAREIFLEALDEPADGRRPFVQLRAGRDADLVRDVLSLLAHHVDAPLMALDRDAPRSAPLSPRHSPVAPAGGIAGRTVGAHGVAQPAPEVIVAERTGRARGTPRRMTRRDRRVPKPGLLALLALVAALAAAWTVARAAVPRTRTPDPGCERP